MRKMPPFKVFSPEGNAVNEFFWAGKQAICEVSVASAETSVLRKTR
jgi:hypothetical protein